MLVVCLMASVTYYAKYYASIIGLGLPIVLSTCASSSICLMQTMHHWNCLCLDSGYLPADWKVHKVILAFKSGDRSLIINDHPISLLSNISKVLECLIHIKIIHHVRNSLYQFGFISNRPITEQLLIIYFP